MRSRGDVGRCRHRSLRTMAHVAVLCCAGLVAACQGPPQEVIYVTPAPAARAVAPAPTSPPMIVPTAAATVAPTSVPTGGTPAMPTVVAPTATPTELRAPVAAKRYAHTGTVLDDGRALVVGGRQGDSFLAGA